MLARLKMEVFALGNCLVLLPSGDLDLECIKINTKMIVDVVDQVGLACVTSGLCGGCVNNFKLNCHTKSKFLDPVAFVPDCAEIHKPPVCWLQHIACKAYTSISLLLFYSCYLKGVLTHTASK
jgi:hypothetical protein